MKKLTKILVLTFFVTLLFLMISTPINATTTNQTTTEHNIQSNLQIETNNQTIQEDTINTKSNENLKTITKNLKTKEKTTVNNNILKNTTSVKSTVKKSTDQAISSWSELKSTIDNLDSDDTTIILADGVDYTATDTLNVNYNVKIIGQTHVNYITDTTSVSNGFNVANGKVLSLENINFSKTSTTTQTDSFIKTGTASTVTITNCNFTNMSTSTTGTVINSQGTLNVNNTVFYNNTGANSAVINHVGKININNTQFINNTVQQKYGIVYLDGSGVVNNTLFENNTSNGYSTSTGTASIYHTTSSIDDILIIDNSQFFKNTAVTYACGLYNRVGNLTVINSKFQDNIAKDLATSYAGAIYIESGNIYINNTNFTSNIAEYDGGAIYIYKSDNVTITYSNFTNNHAMYFGGAIYTKPGQNSYVYIDYSLFDSNVLEVGSGSYEGGAIEAGSSYYTINNTNFTKNKSCNKGSIITSTGTLILNNIIATENYAEGSSGIRTEGTCNITNSQFISNQAHLGGSAIYNLGTLNINNTYMYDNAALEYTGYGGAIYNTGTLNITNSTIDKSRTELGQAGAIYNTNIIIIDNTNITNSYAYSHGGAIYNTGTINITNSNLTNNTQRLKTTVNGGLLYNTGSIKIKNSNILNNSKTFYSTGNLILTQNNITQNNNNYIINILGTDTTNTITYNNIITTTNVLQPIFTITNSNTGTINYNHIYSESNTTQIIYTTTVDNAAVIDAQYNWWGNNTIPQVENITTTNPIVLVVTKGTNNILANNSKSVTILPDGSTTLTAQLKIQTTTDTYSDLKENIPGLVLNKSGTEIPLTQTNNYKTTITGITTDTTYTLDSQELKITPKQVTTSIKDVTYTLDSENNIELFVVVTDSDSNYVSTGSITIKDQNDNTINSTSITTNPSSITIPSSYNEQTITVIYTGNTNYADSNIIKTVNIIKGTTTLTTDDITKSIDTTFITITTILTANTEKITDGNTYLYIDDVQLFKKAITSDTNTTTVTFNNIDISTLNVGEHIIKITYNDSNVLNNSTTTSKLIIKKITTSITDVKTILNTDNNIQISVTIKDLSNNFITTGTITIKDQNDNTINSTSVTTSPTTLTIPNTYNKQVITILYNNTDKYTNISTTKTINIEKVNVDITVPNIETEYNNSKIEINAILSSNNNINNGNIYLYIDDVQYGKQAITSNNNKQTITFNNIDISKLNIGDHTIKITYNDSNIFDNTTATSKLTITKITTITYISKNYQEPILTISAVINANSENIKGTVSFYINNTLTDTVNLSDNTASTNINLRDYVKGNYTITAIYNENDIYKNSKATISFEKNSTIEPNIKINKTIPSTTTSGNIIPITGTITNPNGIPLNETIPVTIIIDGQVITTINATNGTFTYNYTIPNNTTNGTHTIEIITNNTLNYNSTQTNITFKIEKTDLKIYLTNENITAHRLDNINIKALLKDSNNNTINNTIPTTITIENNTVYTNFINGILNYNYTIPSNIKNNNLTINITTNETNSYKPTTNTKTINLYLRNTYIKGTDIHSHVGDTIIINGTIYDSETQNPLNSTTKVAIKVNGKTINTILAVKGIINCNYTTSKLSAKNYTITLKIGTSTVYNESTWTGTIINQRANATIITQENYTAVNDTVTIYANITDKNGNNINNTVKAAIKVSGITVGYANFINGTLKYNYTIPDKCTQNKYNITIQTGYTNQYNKSRAISNILINGKYIQINTVNITAVKDSTITINGNLTNINGKTINTPIKLAIKIDGKTITLPNPLTVQNGKFTFNYTLPITKKVGIHTIELKTGKTSKYISTTTYTNLTIINPTLTKTSLKTSSDQTVSSWTALKAAIDALDSDGTTITLTTGTYGSSQVEESATFEPITVTHSVILQASSNVILYAEAIDDYFIVSGGKTLTLNGMILQGEVNKQFINVTQGSSLVVDNCTFTGINTGDMGGCIGISGTATITNTVFKSNTANSQAPNIYVYSMGLASLSNCSFDTAETYSITSNIGGAIYNEGTVTITNSNISNAEQAIYNTGSITVTGCNISQTALTNSFDQELSNCVLIITTGTGTVNINSNNIFTGSGITVSDISVLTSNSNLLINYNRLYSANGVTPVSYSVTTDQINCEHNWWGTNTLPSNVFIDSTNPLLMTVTINSNTYKAVTSKNYTITDSDTITVALKDNTTTDTYSTITNNISGLVLSENKTSTTTILNGDNGYSVSVTGLTSTDDVLYTLDGQTVHFAKETKTPVDVSINVNSITATIGDTITITSTLGTTGINDGTITFYIDDTLLDTVSVSSSTASTTYSTTGKTSGTYTIKAVYSGSDDYNSATATNTLTLTEEANKEVTITDIYTTLNTDGSLQLNFSVIDVNSNPVKTGTITLQDASGDTITTASVTGNISLTIPSTYNSQILTVIYSGNSVYNDVTSDKLVYASKKYITMYVPTRYAYYGSTTNIYAYLYPTNSGTVTEGTATLAINGTIIAQATVTNNTITFKPDLSGYNAGNYTMNVSYTGNVYNDIYRTGTLTIRKLSTKLYSYNITGYTGKTVTLTANVYSYGTDVNEGYVNYILDDENIATELVSSNKTNTSFTITSAMKDGTHTLLLQYMGTDRFADCNKTVILTIKNENSTSIYLKNVYLDGNGQINLGMHVYCGNDTINGGTITVVVSGNTIGTYDVVNNTVNLTLPTSYIMETNYTVNLSYSGINQFLPSTYNTTILLHKMNTTLSGYGFFKNGYFNVTAHVYSKGKNVTTGTITFTIEGITQTVNVENGTATALLDTQSLEAKEYTYIITYTGNTYYNGNEIYRTATKTAYTTPIYILTNYYFYAHVGDTITIPVTIKNSYTKDSINGTVPLVVKVNGTTIATLDASWYEEIKYTIPSTLTGTTYNITFQTTATSIYKAANSTAYLNLNKTGTYISTSYYYQGLPGDTITITATHKISNGGLTSGTVPGHIYIGTSKIADVNFIDGSMKYILTIPNLSIGNYTMNITTDGTDIYKATNKNTTLRVQKAYTYISSSNVYTNPGKTIQLNATLKNSNKALVNGSIAACIKLNGITIANTYFKNGTLAYNYTVPDTYSNTKYNITYISKETDTYNSATRNSSLRLNLIYTYISSKNIYSHSDDKIIFNATIYDSKTRKAINASPKVCIKINGITLDNIYANNGKILYEYTITDLSAKNYTISYTMGDTNTYRGCTWNGTLINQRATVNIMTNNIKAHVGDKVQINATILNSNTNKKIEQDIDASIKLNGVTIATTQFTNGTLEYNYTIPSDYAKTTGNITIKTGDTNKYAGTNTTVQLLLEAEYVKITVTPITTTVGSTITIKANLTDTNGNLITGTDKACIKIDGTNIADTKFTNGILEYTYTLNSNYTSGIYDLLVKVGATSQYIASTNHATLTITDLKTSTLKTATYETNLKTALKTANTTTTKAYPYLSKTYMLSIRSYVYGSYGIVINEGNLLLFIDSELVDTQSVSNNNANFSINMTNYDYGEHNIEVTYTGTENYDTSTVTSNINKTRYQSNVYVQTGSYYLYGTPGQTITINGTIINSYTKTKVTGEIPVTLLLDGEKLAQFISYDGIISYDYTIPLNQDKNSYNITISTSATDDYKASTRNTIININKVYTYITSSYTYPVQPGASVIINATLHDTNKTLVKNTIPSTIEILGNTYDTAFVNGEMRYNYTVPTTTSYGNYTIYIKTSQTSQYRNASRNCTLKVVNNSKTYTYISSSYIYYGALNNTVLINATLHTTNKVLVNITTPVTIKIDNNTVANTYFVNGTLKYNYFISPTMKVGNHTIDIIANETATYQGTSRNCTLRVMTSNKNYTYISTRNIYSYKLSTVTINASLYTTNKTLVNGTVKACIKIDGKTITNTYFKNGLLEYNYTIPAYRNNNFTITIKSSETNTYQESTKDINLTANTRNIYIRGKNIYTFSGNTILITANITDSKTKTLINGTTKACIKIDGKTLTIVNVVNGTLNYNYTVDKLPGNHTITIKTGESTIYNGSTWNGTLQINKNYTKISSNYITAYVGKITTIKANLTTNSQLVKDTIKATIKINNQTITNAYFINGTLNYNYNTSKLTGGQTYNITITTDNTTYYQGATTTSHLLLNKNKLVITSNNITTTKEKTITISGTLKDYTGNIITTPTTITIKLNNTTIKTITTSTDKYTFQYTLPNKYTKGYYKLYITSKENNYYNNATGYSTVYVTT